mgnify:CR=1 FL=1
MILLKIRTAKLSNNIEVMEYLLDQIDFIEKEIDLPYQQPLKLHGRYTREQILTAFGFSSFDKKAFFKLFKLKTNRLNNFMFLTFFMS